MKKIITLLVILGMSFAVVACGSSDTSIAETPETNSSAEETTGEESSDEKIEILGDTIKIADLNEDDKGKTFSFIANYWTGIMSEYSYHFSYYEEGQEYAFAFELKDETDNKDLSFLSEHNYEDNIAMEIIAVFDDIEYGEQQNFYRFTVKEAKQVDINPAEPKVKDDRYRVGDTIKFTGDNTSFSMTILATDIYYEDGYSFLHIEAEVENTGNEEISIGNMDMDFYGDDYAIEGNIDRYAPFNVQAFAATIAPGRKAKGGFYLNCDNIDAYSVIEGQFADAVIVIKDANEQISTDAGVDTSNNSASDLVGMGYSGEFANPTGDSIIQMTKYDVPDPDGALGIVTIYQGEEFMVAAPYYLDTSGTSDWADWGYDRLYYFYDGEDIYYLGVAYAEEGVVLDYNSPDRNIDMYSECTG